jgi:hypothetical protein
MARVGRKQKGEVMNVETGEVKRMDDLTEQEKQSGKWTPVSDLKMTEQQANLLKRIKNDFTYHKPPESAAKVFVAIRDKAHELAQMIVLNTPVGREQSTALTRLEEAVMHANAGLARQYPAE